MGRTRTNDDIAIVGWHISPMVRRTDMTEAKMLLDVITGATEHAGITRADIDFNCAGSCDYVAGQAFSFVQNIDAIGAWPPKRDSHVEMDGAWALYEAWVRLLLGDIDVAIATGSGRSSTGDPRSIYPMEMDPYYLAPLGADATSLAALQARALLDSGLITEHQMASVAARTRRDAIGNPHAQVTGEFDVDDLLAADYVCAPLRRHDLPPITDGACAVVIARGDRAREMCEQPVWITGFAHVSESHYPGMRDLRRADSITAAARAAGLAHGTTVEVAELQTAYSHEEPLVASALGLGAATTINPSGGPLAANPIMATGLVRIAEAASQVRNGRHRTLAHSTSGPCLQQNLVCILEGDD